MPSKNCPNCKLTNPASAEVCDCGHMFSASSAQTFELSERNRKEFQNSKNSDQFGNSGTLFRAVRLIMKLLGH